MTTKSVEARQLYFEIDGELKPMQIGATINLEDCAEIVSDVDGTSNNPEYFKGVEITFKISKKECKRLKKVLQSVMPKYFTNNWRKMHHLPIIRRRGKKK